MTTYYLSQESFEKIFILLKENKTVYCSQVEKTRVFLEGVYHIMRTGCQWNELPSYYGAFKSVHKRYLSWSRKGIWSGLLSSFTKKGEDTSSVMIDSTVARAHACAAGYEKDSQEEQALGRSKGGFSTKIHACVDAKGNALRFTLTPGQRHDVTQAQTLTKDLHDSHVIADKAYDCDEFLDSIKKRNCTPVIPPKKIVKIQETTMLKNISNVILLNASLAK